MTALTIEHQTLETSHVLILTGDLDLATADELRDSLTTIPLHERADPGDRPRPGRVLRLQRSAALVAARNRTLATHAEIALTAVPPPIARMLPTLDLDTAFPIHPNT